MQAFFTIFAVGLALLTALAVVWDLRLRRIPNWLTVGGFASALLFHGISGGWAGLGTALAGFAVGFSLLLVLWLIGGGGGGDVKLMGALGAWLGPMHILFVFILSTLLVLVIALGVLVFRLFKNGMSLSRKDSVGESSDSITEKNRLASDSKQRLQVPYALPVAMSAWVILAWKFFLLQG